MKKLLLLILVFTPYIVFSQGGLKNEIKWLTLDEAKVLAKKYDSKVLIFFYKKNCPYCDKMKKETLTDPDVIKFINNNFFAVKIDSRTKDTIIYNNIAYGNQQPESSGRHDWRNDFYAEVAAFNVNGSSQVTTPSIVIFNSNFEKINCNCPHGALPGNQPKPLLLRNLNRFLN